MTWDFRFLFAESCIDQRPVKPYVWSIYARSNLLNSCCNGLFSQVMNFFLDFPFFVIAVSSIRCIHCQAIPGLLLASESTVGLEYSLPHTSALLLEEHIGISSRHPNNRSPASINTTTLQCNWQHARLRFIRREIQVQVLMESLELRFRLLCRCRGIGIGAPSSIYLFCRCDIVSHLKPCFCWRRLFVNFVLVLSSIIRLIYMYFVDPKPALKLRYSTSLEQKLVSFDGDHIQLPVPFPMRAHLHRLRTLSICNFAVMF